MSELLKLLQDTAAKEASETGLVSKATVDRARDLPEDEQYEFFAQNFLLHGRASRLPTYIQHQPEFVWYALSRVPSVVSDHKAPKLIAQNALDLLYRAGTTGWAELDLSKTKNNQEAVDGLNLLFSYFSDRNARIWSVISQVQNAPEWFTNKLVDWVLPTYISSSGIPQPVKDAALRRIQNAQDPKNEARRLVKIFGEQVASVGGMDDVLLDVEANPELRGVDSLPFATRLDFIKRYPQHRVHYYKLFGTQRALQSLNQNPEEYLEQVKQLVAVDRQLAKHVAGYITEHLEDRNGPAVVKAAMSDHELFGAVGDSVATLWRQGLERHDEGTPVHNELKALLTKENLARLEPFLSVNYNVSPLIRASSPEVKKEFLKSAQNSTLSELMTHEDQDAAREQMERVAKDPTVLPEIDGAKIVAQIAQQDPQIALPWIRKAWETANREREGRILGRYLSQYTPVDAITDNNVDFLSADDLVKNPALANHVFDHFGNSEVASNLALEHSHVLNQTKVDEWFDSKLDQGNLRYADLSTILTPRRALRILTHPEQINKPIGKIAQHPDEAYSPELMQLLNERAALHLNEKLATADALDDEWDFKKWTKYPLPPALAEASLIVNPEGMVHHPSVTPELQKSALTRLWNSAVSHMSDDNISPDRSRELASSSPIFADPASNILGHTPHADVQKHAFDLLEHRKKPMSSSVMGRIVDNKSLHPDIAERLVRNHLLRSTGDEAYNVSTLINNNPSLSQDSVMALANKHDSYEVRSEFVHHPSTPEETAIKFLDNYDIDLRANHRNWSRPALEHLVRSRNVNRHFLQFHNQIDDTLLEDLLNDDDFKNYRPGLVEEIPDILKLHRPDNEHSNAVEVRFDTNRLRIARDLISGPTPKSKVPGFNPNWAKHVADGKGIVTPESIQKYIDSFPATKYNVKTDLTWDGPQRHNDQDSKVFQVQVTTDQMKELRRHGIFGSYLRLHSGSLINGHPSDQFTLGWVRWTGNHTGIQIDEAQSDFGSHLNKVKKDPSSNIPPEHIDKIQEVLFGGRHPSHVLQECFHQHMRNSGYVNTPIAIHHFSTKAPLSSLDTHKKLPAHFYEGYGNIPKQMGMKPSEYGKLPTQSNPNLKGKHQFEDTVRKREDLFVDAPLQKGVMGAVAGIALSQMSPQLKEAFDRVQLQPQIQQVKMEAPKWTPEGLHANLVPIAHLESSFGRNMNHLPHSKGEYHTAYGPLGMKPSTAHEEWTKSKKLRETYPGLEEPAKFMERFKKDWTFHNLVASSHFLRLLHRHGSPEKAAYAWRWGSTATANASDEQVSSDNYVMRYRDLSASTGLKKSESSIPVQHYSRTDGLKELHPRHMGTGMMGAERNRPNRIPRIYLYARPGSPEMGVVAGAPHLYHGELPHGTKLYDMGKDELGLNVPKWKHTKNGMEYHVPDLDKVERKLQRMGYHGYHNYGVKDAIAYFHSLPVTQVGPNGKPLRKGDGSLLSHVTYRPFEPHQVKSVHNVGTYSDDPDILKSEEDLNKMAIKDIRPGPAIDSPEDPSWGDDAYDYSHVLPKKLRKDYRVVVTRHYPLQHRKVTARVFHIPTNKNVGFVGAYITGLKTATLDVAELREAHRGKGLGTHAYEALYADLYHNHGIRKIEGDTHSSSAGRAHQKIAEKHDLDYPYKDVDIDAKIESGRVSGLPYDAAMGPYDYKLR